MQSLPGLLARLWGSRQAERVAAEYRSACENHSLFVRDLALFCNAAAPVTGTCEFDRGVEEGKRRVWLHLARLAGLQPTDFISITDGETAND